nr:hypothetical protein [Tanacetum cinerariifolium]
MFHDPARAGGIYPGTLPLDRVEVLGSVDGVTTSFQLSRNSRHSMLDHQDKYMMKAQVHVSKSSAISDVQPLPRRKPYCQIYQVVKHMLRGRLLASFQDREHEGGDTRSQGGIKDNDIKIKMQDHNMQMISQMNSQDHKASRFKKVMEMIRLSGFDSVLTWTFILLGQEWSNGSIKDEEVSLVDGVLEGVLGALEALEMEALVDAMDVDNG